MKSLPLPFAVLLLAASFAFAQNNGDDDERIPTLTVTGNAQVNARPDRAVIRLGAVAQAPEAGEAQEQVNAIMQEAIGDIKALGIPAERISTATLSLSPVYSQPPREQRQQPFEPKIVAFRANNTVQVVVDDLSKVGPVIDAGVEAGANQLEGLSFELADDTRARTQALVEAAQKARSKAQALAEALDVQLAGVLTVHESGQVIPLQRRGPQMMRAEAMMAATPVEPGQVNVEASVTVEYRIANNVLGRPARP